VGIAADAGLPEGLLNVVVGAGPQAGVPLVEHPDVRKVSFTGSMEVGNSCTSVRINTPFGGFNQSGVGRELRMHALDSYTERKNLFIIVN
jgi:acyl-CoA reductase-like NAD-dependent aldehyde dehydrogenase